MSKKKYGLGETVYVITDKEQNKRIVTGIMQRVTGYQYELTLCGATMMAYAIELKGQEEVDKETPAIGFKNQACLS